MKRRYGNRCGSVDLSETDCNEILVEIETFIDGEVQAVRYEQIEKHLSLCPPCLERMDFRQRLKEIISRRCCSESVPQELVDKIRAVLASEA